MTNNSLFFPNAPARARATSTAVTDLVMAGRKSPVSPAARKSAAAPAAASLQAKLTPTTVGGFGLAATAASSSLTWTIQKKNRFGRYQVGSIMHVVSVNHLLASPLVSTTNISFFFFSYFIGSVVTR
jgi:hypothetical protein